MNARQLILEDDEDFDPKDFALREIPGIELEPVAWHGLSMAWRVFYKPTDGQREFIGYVGFDGHEDAPSDVAKANWQELNWVTEPVNHWDRGDFQYNTSRDSAIKRLMNKAGLKVQESEDFDPKDYVMNADVRLFKNNMTVIKTRNVWITAERDFSGKPFYRYFRRGAHWFSSYNMSAQDALIQVDEIEDAGPRQKKNARYVIRGFSQWLQTERPKWIRGEAEETDDPKDYALTRLYDWPVHSGDITDRDGNVIRRSRNMRGVRNYTGRQPVSRVNIWSTPGEAGGLEIIFQDGSRYRTRFESFSTLKWTLRNWRNLYGAPLFIEDRPAGQVRFQNASLIESLEDEAKEYVLMPDRLPEGVTLHNNLCDYESFDVKFNGERIGLGASTDGKEWHGYMHGPGYRNRLAPHQYGPFDTINQFAWFAYLHKDQV